MADLNKPIAPSSFYLELAGVCEGEKSVLKDCLPLTVSALPAAMVTVPAKSSTSGLRTVYLLPMAARVNGATTKKKVALLPTIPMAMR